MIDELWPWAIGFHILCLCSAGHCNRPLLLTIDDLKGFDRSTNTRVRTSVSTYTLPIMIWNQGFGSYQMQPRAPQGTSGDHQPCCPGFERGPAPND
jgi:hypothetical protein